MNVLLFPPFSTRMHSIFNLVQEVHSTVQRKVANWELVIRGRIFKMNIDVNASYLVANKEGSWINLIPSSHDVNLR